MLEAKEKYLERARERAAVDPSLAFELGLAVLVGIEELKQFEAYAGRSLRTHYTTHFPLEGESELRLTLQRAEAPDAAR